MEATELFENAITWLQGCYADFRFFTERDIVWTVQLHIYREIEKQGLPYRVFNDHTILPRIRSDLAILKGDSIEVAAEFKYEPDHNRRADRGGDIWQSKFPVAVWAEVKNDIHRVHNFVELGKSKAAYSILIDEGGHFHWHDAPPRSEWIDWGQGRWVLWSQISRG